MKKPKRGTKIPFEINPMAPENQEYFDLMFNILGRFVPHFYPSLTNAVIHSCDMFFFKKNDILVDYGEIDRYCFFPIRGLLKSEKLYKAIERVVWFMAECDVVISLKSFYGQIPSLERITALEDTLCIAILKEKLDAIYDEHQTFERLGRLLAEHYHGLTMDRTMWMTLEGKERYELFFQDYPKFINRINNKDMASFLGVCLGQFKKIKKEYWKK